jgi:hypothetical protein
MLFLKMVCLTVGLAFSERCCNVTNAWTSLARTAPASRTTTTCTIPVQVADFPVVPTCNADNFQFKDASDNRALGIFSSSLGVVGLLLNLLTVVVVLRQGGARTGVRARRPGRPTPCIVMTALAVSDSVEILFLLQWNLQFVVDDKSHFVHQWIYTNHFWLYPLQVNRFVRWRCGQDQADDRSDMVKQRHSGPKFVNFGIKLI